MMFLSLVMIVSCYQIPSFLILDLKIEDLHHFEHNLDQASFHNSDEFQKSRSIDPQKYRGDHQPIQSANGRQGFGVSEFYECFQKSKHVNQTVSEPNHDTLQKQPNKLFSNPILRHSFEIAHSSLNQGSARQSRNFPFDLKQQISNEYTKIIKNEGESLLQQFFNVKRRDFFKTFQNPNVNTYNYNPYQDKYYDEQINHQSDFKPSGYQSQQFGLLSNIPKKSRNCSPITNILVPGKMKKGVKSGGIQEQLLCWIRQQNLEGIAVGRVETMDKARQFGRCIDFRASTGWYSNFIRRNPDIREILKRGNSYKRNMNKSNGQNGDRMMVKQRQSSEYDDFSFDEHNDGIEDEDEFKNGHSGIYSENEQSSFNKQQSDLKEQQVKKSDNQTKE